MHAVNGETSPAATAMHAVPRAHSNAIALVEERLALLEAEGLGSMAWDTFYAGCSYSRSIGDKVAASTWASRAADAAKVALGCDSDEYQKYAAYVGNRRATKSK
mmetsp:Transcript_16432/g.42160  ORF Transcript_16432/g.42160 Transcript_16432/m.42160 type:complete len:104 (-) Transcript_16432:185-496(-)